MNEIRDFDLAPSAHWIVCSLSKMRFPTCGNCILTFLCVVLDKPRRGFSFNGLFMLSMDMASLCEHIGNLLLYVYIFMYTVVVTS